MTSETVHLDGHIIDSRTLSKVLDLILLHGGDYEITHFRIGTTREEASHAEIVVRAPDAQDDLQHILQEVGQHGAAPSAHEAEWVAAPLGRRLPRRVLLDDEPRQVRPHARTLAARRAHRDGLRRRAATTRRMGRARLHRPLHRVQRGDRVLVDDLARARWCRRRARIPAHVFGFMSSEVSAERPKELTVAAVAAAWPTCAARGLKILFVGGPAIIHTGAGRLPRSG